MQLPDVMTFFPFVLGTEIGSLSCPDATHHNQKNMIRISLIAILIKKDHRDKISAGGFALPFVHEISTLSWNHRNTE